MTEIYVYVSNDSPLTTSIQTFSIVESGSVHNDILEALNYLCISNQGLFVQESLVFQLLFVYDVPCILFLMLMTFFISVPHLDWQWIIFTIQERNGNFLLFSCYNIIQKIIIYLNIEQKLNTLIWCMQSMLGFFMSAYRHRLRSSQLLFFTLRV